MSRVFFADALDTVASFWRIWRRDGVALAFTTHDRDLWFDGLLHRSAPGLTPSAIRRTAGFEDDGIDIDGALSHDTLTESDLLAGRYDGASIAVGAVDWEGLDRIILYRGSITALARDANGFTARIRSAKAALDIDPVPRSSPGCRARFCGPGCTLPTSRFIHRVRVTAIDLENNSIRFDGIEPNQFLEGELRWLDGPQAGLRFAVIASATDGALVLDRKLSPMVASGDRALLREGCDHTIATCTARFANAANFRGEPFLPGSDHVAHYPMPR